VFGFGTKFFNVEILARLQIATVRTQYRGTIILTIMHSERSIPGTGFDSMRSGK
jgi:hypothetical protein